MINGWVVPAVGIFLVTQASAAIWWASSTNNQVEHNTVQIEQVVDNERQIAVIEVQQNEIQKRLQTSLRSIMWRDWIRRSSQ